MLLGFGFLTFDSEESAEAVVKEHFVQLNGKQVRRIRDTLITALMLCNRKVTRGSGITLAQGLTGIPVPTYDFVGLQ